MTKVFAKLEASAIKAERDKIPMENWLTLASFNMDDLNSPLSQYEKQLEGPRDEFKPVGGRSKVLAERAFWPRKKDKVMKALESLKSQKALFEEALSIEQMWKKHKDYSISSFHVGTRS